MSTGAKQVKQPIITLEPIIKEIDARIVLYMISTPPKLVLMIRYLSSLIVWKPCHAGLVLAHSAH